MMRRIAAARARCEAIGRCDLKDPRYYNFSRLFIFNGEHTWGGDTKAFLHDTENWSNVGSRATCHLGTVPPLSARAAAELPRHHRHVGGTALLGLHGAAAGAAGPPAAGGHRARAGGADGRRGCAA